MVRSRLTSNATRYAGQAGRAMAAAALRDARSAASTGVDAAREAARINSYTVPSQVLGAADAGDGTATINVLDHLRVYPVGGSIDVPDLNLVDVADVLGAAFATTYFPYYDDLTLQNPTPVVHLTTNPTIAQAGYAPGRHPLGSITTPAAAGSAATTGEGPEPSGYNRFDNPALDEG
jgi:hypothetical protein